MGSQSDKVIVGRIMAVHGIKGWVKVYSHTDPMENIFEYQPWYLSKGRDWEEVKLAGARPQGKGLVVAIDGIGDREQAARELVGREIAVSESLLPRSGDGEFYWLDLIGLRVVLPDGRDLGRVDRLMETGANDVLVVIGDANSLDRRERLLPWVPDDVIVDVALERGEIRVDWDPEF